VRITIYRGTHEIGGTLIECSTDKTRLLIDAGYPLFLNGLPIESGVAFMPPEKLMENGVLPAINGLYSWDKPSFDAVIISHAHIDHYGLTKYAHPDIPIYVSAGTETLIEISRTFKIYDSFPINTNRFNMSEPFSIGDILVKPYLMDHSAFDAAAFEIKGQGKTVIYSGDFRGHGRKSVCLDVFIQKASKQADLLLTEGTLLGRLDEKVKTEYLLEEEVINEVKDRNGPVLFQCSSQNIDRIVSFYKAARKLGKTFVIDIYTANVLYDLRQLGNKLPYPCKSYPNIKVYPYRITRKISDEIGDVYAKRFTPYRLSEEIIRDEQNNIFMLVRPSMLNDLKKCNLKNGLFIYSLWKGYRSGDYQKRFEDFLRKQGFTISPQIHTSGHATLADIQRLIKGLNPKRIVPIHSMNPHLLKEFSDKVEVMEDGKQFFA
jgi:ribonuclease J